MMKTPSTHHHNHDEEDNAGPKSNFSIGQIPANFMPVKVTKDTNGAITDSRSTIISGSGSDEGLGDMDLEAAESKFVSSERQQENSSKFEYNNLSKDTPNRGCKQNKLIWYAVCSIFVITVLLFIIIIMAYTMNMKDDSEEEESIAPTSTVSISPSPVPTLHPSTSPVSSQPTSVTSSIPTIFRSAPPSSVPTMVTSSVPTIDPSSPIIHFLQQYGVIVILQEEDEKMDAANRAIRFILAEMEAQGTDHVELNESIVQRFAMLVLAFALTDESSCGEDGEHRADESKKGTDVVTVSELPPPFSEQSLALERFGQNRTLHECLWDGVTCSAGTNIVTELRIAGMDLHGTIPTEIFLLRNLTYLDASNNALHNSIPSELFDLVLLESIYLYKNHLNGTLSPHIGQLSNVRIIHLSHNQLTGSIPCSIRSSEAIRPLEYLNLYRNQLTGIIPSGLRLRHMFYFDVGRNQLVGTVPEDLGEKFIRLRHLHLDHNRLHGTMPESCINAGNGRLESLTVNHNQFSGIVPSDHVNSDKLVTFTLDSNNFTDLGRDTCKLSVFESGEMVEFKADCDICKCKEFCDFLCVEEIEEPFIFNATTIKNNSTGSDVDGMRYLQQKAPNG